MSENGVKYRLDKLEEEGVIRRYAVLIDPKKIGKKVMAVFDIELAPKDMKNKINELVNLEEFIKVYYTTGNYSIVAIGLFDSNKELINFINNRLLEDFPIRDYTANIVTKTYKDSIYLI